MIVIDGGLALMMVGAIAQVVTLAQEAIAFRQWQRSDDRTDAERARDRRIAAADAALANDPLIAGVAAIEKIYRRY